MTDANRPIVDPTTDDSEINKPWIVVWGHPRDGFTYEGPFLSLNDAWAHCETLETVIGAEHFLAYPATLNEPTRVESLEEDELDEYLKQIKRTEIPRSADRSIERRTESNSPLSGAELKTARLAANLTVGEVAVATCRAAQSVARWESGATRVPETVLPLLRRLYGIEEH